MCLWVELLINLHHTSREVLNCRMHNPISVFIWVPAQIFPDARIQSSVLIQKLVPSWQTFSAVYLERFWLWHSGLEFALDRLDVVHYRADIKLSFHGAIFASYCTRKTAAVRVAVVDVLIYITLEFVWGFCTLFCLASMAACVTLQTRVFKSAVIIRDCWQCPLLLLDSVIDSLLIALYVFDIFEYTFEIIWIYIYIYIIEGSLEVKLPTIWTDEKQSREEAERRERLEERRVEEKE